MRLVLLLAAAQALAPEHRADHTFSVDAGGAAETVTFARRHPTALVETQVGTAKTKAAPPNVQAAVQTVETGPPVAPKPRVKPWLSPFILDEKKDCVKTKSCEPCPASTGDVSDLANLAKCEPALQTHEEVLDSITDAAGQCNGRTVLSSTVLNERRSPPGPAKFVCFKCEQKGGATLITLGNAEAKPDCSNCAPSCQDSCSNATKKDTCTCKEGTQCDVSVCTGKCCTEEAWVDLTEGGKTVPKTEPSIYTLVEPRAIQGCEGGAMPLFALAMLVLTLW